MFQKDIFFIYAEPDDGWAEEIVTDIILSLPGILFGEITSWDSIITQAPFIKPFSINEALEKMAALRADRRANSDTVFPLDSNESETNLNKIIYGTPLRIMLFGDKSAPLYEVGELLANKFNTYLITPKKLIVQQVKKRTKIGAWLYWNIMEARGIPIWVINNLLKIELKKDMYTNKGFILLNWPIMPALNAQIKCPCMFKDEENYEIEHQYENPTEFDGDTFLEKLSHNISDMSNSVYNKENILKIVRGKKFVDINGDENAVLSNCARNQLKLIQYLWCTPQFIIFLDNTPCSKEFTAILDDLETFCLLNCPENVIHVDCGIGINAIYNCICNRFHYMYHKVNYECTPMNLTQNGLLTVEDLCNTDKILPNFKWQMSKFGRICPVNLYFGRRRLCSSLYPVRYLRYLFLCHSPDDRKTFMEHPGKYMNALPTCRIAIIGPHRIGKSTLAKQLGWFFKSDIYKRHILQAEMDIKHHMGIYEEELQKLEHLWLQNFVTLSRQKIEEWSVCVLNLVNEAITKAFPTIERDETTNSHFELFPNKLAKEYFEINYKSQVKTYGMEQLILENAIFNKTIENMSSLDFLEWLRKKSELPFKHRQYVLDCAPLDSKFWEELLLNDELPDCVFFFNVPPIEKMMEIYSRKHNLDCINQDTAIEGILNNCKEWKNRPVSNTLIDTANNIILDVNGLPYLKHLIQFRYTEALQFSQKYNALQTFLQANHVSCINIDISKLTWTQTIVKAISDYLLTYQLKPTAVCAPSFRHYDSEESLGATSASSHLDDITESDHTVVPCLNYGIYQDWCPVLLRNNNCLLKGNLRYAAEYKNEIYLMHSQNALREFISNPNIFINSKPVAPLPKILVLGITLKSEVEFADSLATALYTRNIPCMQLFTTFPNIGVNAVEFSMENVQNKYNEIRYNFLLELSAQLKNGGVVCGFPLTVEQFNDLITNKLYPEYVLLFDDTEKIVFAIYQYILELNTLNCAKSAEFIEFSHRFDGLISTQTNSKIKLSNQEIMKRARNILRPFYEEMEKIKIACIELRIPIITIPKYFKRRKMVEKCVNRINYNKNRGAYFENVKWISTRDSQLLLNCGYYWFSRFKYSCPVDVGHLITVNHYEGMIKQDNVYPCIYNDFIYFVNGKNNFKTFKSNPLDYINTCNPPQMNYPLRIAIYGLPKSGVTTICKFIFNELAIRIISPKDFPSKKMSNTDLITHLKAYKSSTANGLVLDNLELTPTFLVEAAKNNVDINLVLIFVPSFKKVLNNWMNQNNLVKNVPKFVLLDIYKKFCEKKKTIRNIRKSVDTCLFNIHYLDTDVNTWSVWNKVKHLIIKTTRSISGYKLKLLKNRCANVTCLNLFYETLAFKRHYNHFYCQVCLSLGKLNAFKYYYADVGREFYSKECQELYNKPYGYSNNDVYNKFKFSKPFEYNSHVEPLATQKKYAMSMFQYKSIIYWTCSVHTIDFMMYAALYETECHKIKPLYIPFLVNGFIKKNIAYDGYCPIEYLAGKLIKGNIKLSIYYRRKVYLMANKDNAIEFLSRPEKYRKINFEKCLQLNSEDKKTFYGLKEDDILTALSELSYTRPKHFILSARQSAVSYIALKLKTGSTYSRSDSYWHMCLHAFTQDCKTLADRLKQFQKTNLF